MNDTSSRFYGDATWLAAMATIVLAALAAPGDIVSRVPRLAALADAASSHLPFVAAFARLSPWPQVTTFTFLLAIGLAFLAMPLFVYFHVRLLDPATLKDRADFEWSCWPIAALACIPFIWPGPALDGVGRPAGWEGAICHSRLALGVFASALMLVQMYALSAPFIWLKCALHRGR
ncbi:hypothetical protein [Massilia yuzhufengensis]|uniref:Uncharacterized protein n=1 Tax=Massilia yuzhufengensis TaxID=1164594 RepID=A0A1I1EAP8_9BURK|nr:hypothetical protein [Massilia yuzhufengensis]SFB84171.1 hypothetical protein SAMN05216204_10258 [Massilia yuzhufengensis]